ncbi:amidohydrolase [Thalassobacillus sp. CUG 92003]|uniref:amidohydrolase n=1 Tax=Thalassobacillus sp. CUG 92003 TaxID=2736641 RepID=UPI0015E6B0E2|nr:amidohydrolase [Thalassobacillus sp. CUG 92003]
MTEAETYVETILPKLIEWRRSLHRYPELGFMEYVTTYRIGKELEALGFTVHIGQDAIVSDARFGVPDQADLEAHEEEARRWGVEASWLQRMQGGHTGLAAVWDTGSPGDHIAFRFDIDALPIQETNEAGHHPYDQGFTSTNDGVMHACGHDGHTTLGLGLAYYIAHHARQLTGRFTLLFQPAEEGGRGAKSMTDKGWLQDADAFYTGHIGINPMEIGTVAAAASGFLASSKLDATFTGVAAHAGMKPEAGRNALLAAATATTQLYTIPRHSQGVSRINVGKLEAGNARNIISDHGYLELEARGETEAISDYVLTEAKRILHASADLHGVNCAINFAGKSEGIACSPVVYEQLAGLADASHYVKHVLKEADVSGSEDASFMINAVQQQGGTATYMLFGTDLPFGHHHPSFDFNEAVIPVALTAYIHLLKGGL